MMSDQTIIRQASHAGSWYSKNSTELRNQLQVWLDAAGPPSQSPARAIISPHAGYLYCGSCAGFAYKQIVPSLVKRIFILGPSHHQRLSNCALSTADYYHTPLYNLPIDKNICEDMINSASFGRMNMRTDEDEHSIEMQMPYIAKVMEGHDFTIVPVLVGSLTPEKEELYGKFFSKYLADPSVLFVISSDFCHWGSRFHYQYYEKSWGEIHQSIQRLDLIAMKLIEQISPSEFGTYLKNYNNTICGRHPIGVLLNAIYFLNGREKNLTPSIRFLDYSQSSRCRNMTDSSVSYAAAALTLDYSKITTDQDA